jgi:hypothetical protein
MSRIADAYDRLRGHWSALQGQWHATRQVWRDGVGDRFEREFWQEWEAAVPPTLKAIRELEEILHQAEIHMK